MENLKYVQEVINTVLSGLYSKAVKYVSPNFIIRATRIGKIDGRDKRIDIRLTIGKPNFIEREFIKQLKESKTPFPVRKIHLKLYKTKKEKLKKKS